MHLPTPPSSRDTVPPPPSSRDILPPPTPLLPVVYRPENNYRPEDKMYRTEHPMDPKHQWAPVNQADLQDSLDITSMFEYSRNCDETDSSYSPSIEDSIVNSYYPPSTEDSNVSPDGISAIPNGKDRINKYMDIEQETRKHGEGQIHLMTHNTCSRVPTARIPGSPDSIEYMNFRMPKTPVPPPVTCEEPSMDPYRRAHNDRFSRAKAVAVLGIGLEFPLAPGVLREQTKWVPPPRREKSYEDLHAQAIARKKPDPKVVLGGWDDNYEEGTIGHLELKPIEPLRWKKVNKPISDGPTPAAEAPRGGVPPPRCGPLPPTPPPSPGKVTKHIHEYVDDAPRIGRNGEEYRRPKVKKEVIYLRSPPVPAKDDYARYRFPKDGHDDWYADREISKWQAPDLYNPPKVYTMPKKVYPPLPKYIKSFWYDLEDEEDTGIAASLGRFFKRKEEKSKKSDKNSTASSESPISLTTPADFLQSPSPEESPDQIPFVTDYPVPFCYYVPQPAVRRGGEQKKTASKFKSKISEMFKTESPEEKAEARRQTLKAKIRVVGIHHPDN